MKRGYGGGLVNVVPNPPPHGVRRPRRASILDVAALAGVSAATVSRSLRGHSSISAATRQRVLEAAQQLSYSASPQASGLASGRTLTIGVVVPFVTRWFFVNVVAGGLRGARTRPATTCCSTTSAPAARDRFFERMPLARRVDAVLTLTVPLTEEHTLALRALDMPLVTLGAALPGVPSVRIDDVAAMRTAVHHLLHQGHEEIAMITGRRGRAPTSASPPPAAAARATGRRCCTAGLADRIDFVSADTYGIEGGARAMAELMDRPTLPTAVVAEYDELAIGALRTLRRASIAVPGRMSVVGRRRPRDGLGRRPHHGRPARPGAGRRAARLLLDTRRPRRRAAEVVLPTRLVVRGQHRHPLDPAVLVGHGQKRIGHGQK